MRQFLVADEVGLGKTMVARGVIAKTIEALWDRSKRIDILYICSNQAIAAQNLNRLNVAVTRARHKRIVIGDSTTLAGQEGGRRRAPGDLLVSLYEGCEQKKKWGIALGGQQ